MIALVVSYILSLVLEFGVWAFIVKFISWCFDLQISIKALVGLYVLILLVKFIFKNNKN